MPGTRLDMTSAVGIAFCHAFLSARSALPMGKAPREEHAMPRTKPPFRADHVGSILRSAAIKEAREKHAKGAIDTSALKAVEDREIETIVRKQEEIGLQLATDGEYRRSWWQDRKSTRLNSSHSQISYAV